MDKNIFKGSMKYSRHNCAEDQQLVHGSGVVNGGWWFVRHQQVPVDGPHRRQHGAGRAHPRGGVLHALGRVPRRRRRLRHAAQLPHVQDELLQVRSRLHRGR